MKRTGFKIKEKSKEIKWENPGVMKKILAALCIILGFFVIMYLGYFTAGMLYNNFSEKPATGETQNSAAYANF